MAPKKRKAEASSSANETLKKPAFEVAPLRRITRSLTRDDSVPPPEPKPKRKAKPKAKPKAKAAVAASSSKKRGRKPAKSAPEPEPQPEPTIDGNNSDNNEASGIAEEEEDEDDGEGDDDEDDDVHKLDVGSFSKTTTIVIEHCLQCKRIKAKALECKAAIEKDVPDVDVVINPEKPKRGRFEIRTDDGEIFTNFEDLKRPFTPLKTIVMEKVIADIKAKIQAD